MTTGWFEKITPMTSKRRAFYGAPESLSTENSDLEGIEGAPHWDFWGRSRAKPTRFDVVEPLIMIYSGLMVISWSWNWISIFVECRVVKVGSSPWGFSQFNQNKNFQRATLMDFIENPGCRTKMPNSPIVNGPNIQYGGSGLTRWVVHLEMFCFPYRY